MRARMALSMAQNKAYDKYADEQGFVDTDKIDKDGMGWELNEGDDGPTHTGPEWTRTISLPGYGDQWKWNEETQEWE